jgi:thioredoxin reductase
MHGYLSRDGTSPQEFLAVSREEIGAYDGRIIPGQVTVVTPTVAGFTVGCSNGSTIAARRVIIATGLVDRLPDIPGLAGRWGRDVVHCPDCHGWELRDRPTAVLASTPEDLTKAMVISRLSGDTVLILQDLRESDLTTEVRRRLVAAHVEVLDGRATELVVESDVLAGIRMDDGRLLRRNVLYISPRFDVRDQLLSQLGVDMRDTKFGRYPVTDETGLSSVPGVWIVGNAASATEQVVHAASGGYKAAQALSASLVLEDLDRGAQRGGGLDLSARRWVETDDSQPTQAGVIPWRSSTKPPCP